MALKAVYCLCLQARRLYEEAFRTADMARLRSHALNNLAHLRYVEAGSDYGVLQETVEQYQRAIGFDETNVDAWYNLGKSLEDLGLREQALEAFTRVLQIDPAHPGAHLNIGNYYLLKVCGRATPSASEGCCAVGEELTPDRWWMSGLVVVCGRGRAWQPWRTTSRW